MNKDFDSNDPQVILTHAIDQLKQKLGDKFDINKINLEELRRLTGISRGKLRHYQKDGFIIKPHGRTGLKAEKTVLTGYTGVLDNLLRSNVTNAAVCLEKLRDQGYAGGLTQVRVYIENHQELIPPKRQLISPQGNRGNRYTTGPGESFQMDWGFVSVTNTVGENYRCACFAMICHHCGERYIEFFPNAKQENLFIGMLHAFLCIGVPKNVLTDNMKSVVIGRDPDNHPIWQKDYEVFMKTVGFETKLCKPRHPFTKGAVERLIRFVKENFIAGRMFSNVTDLNVQALNWCSRQNNTYHRAVDCVPEEKHQKSCWKVAVPLEMKPEFMNYLCPLRRISFDGFVNYEGRRFGVPYWYHKKVCRIQRKAYELYIYDEDLSRILTSHDVTWSHKDSFCRDQFVLDQPEEFPTMPVKATMFQIEEKVHESGFDKFNFEEGLWND